MLDGVFGQKAKQARERVLKAASRQPPIEKQLDQAPGDAGRESPGVLEELGEEGESVGGWQVPAAQALSDFNLGEVVGREAIKELFVEPGVDRETRLGGFDG